MKSNNMKYKHYDALQSAIFGALLFLTLFLLAKNLPGYMETNRPSCKQEMIVKEILEVKGINTIVKLNNGEIITTKTRDYNTKEDKFKTYLKINEPICVAYESSIDYYLAYMLLSFKFR